MDITEIAFSLYLHLICDSRDRTEYINDICKVSKVMKFVLFADDTNIVCSGDKLKQLLAEITQEMNRLKNWFNKNKLSLNLKKTKLMLFGNKKADMPVQISIDNTIIERVKENLFLGIMIDEKISWKPHISYLRKKVAKCIGVMKRSCHVLNQSALLTLYHSLVMSHMSYCIEIWGNCYKTNLIPLVNLQKKAIRLVYKVHYNDHTNPLFLKSQSLKIMDLITFKTAQVMFNASKKCLPGNIQNVFKDRESHNYNLRRINKLYQPTTNTKRKSMCISVEGVKLWNSLGDELKNCTTLSQFKSLFKKQMLKKYLEETY